jgi:hypothetical protein
LTFFAGGSPGISSRLLKRKYGQQDDDRPVCKYGEKVSETGAKRNKTKKNLTLITAALCHSVLPQKS